jgi:hypothetical protein
MGLLEETPAEIRVQLRQLLDGKGIQDLINRHLNNL